MAEAPKIIRFILVGATSAAALLGLTWLFVDGLQLQVLVGSSLAVVLTGLYNYSMQYYWTFTSNAPHGGVLVRYLFMAAGVLIINALVMHFGVEVMDIHYLIVQFAANVAMAAWSFTIGSLWVFVRED
ncbi:MAG: putative flippase GtrA [Halioglobus sp.]|jgi:putative flippase GtrA